MFASHYESVSTLDGEDYERNGKGIWTPFLRQLFVNSGVWTIYFSLGLCFGAPTVLIPQLRQEANSTEAVSDDMASWLLSVHGYTALPWIFVIPPLTTIFGRKIPFMISCATSLAGFIVFYLSTDPLTILISEIMQGFLLGSNITFIVIIIIEYTEPEYRGLFITIKATTFFVGVWVANIIGTFSHWKNIGIVAFVCIIYSGSCVFWPESPYWLASKGRFEESAKSFRWLRGCNLKSETELETFIKTQKKLRAASFLQPESTSYFQVSNFFNHITDPSFYKPMLLSMCVISLYHLSGKFVCVMYSIDIIKKITKSESAAYTGMLILEFVTILGMLFGSLLSKYLKRRTLLIGSSSIGILFLFVIASYLYLVKLAYINEDKYMSIALLTLFSIAICCGPMILAGAVFGELISFEHKSYSLLLLALYSEILMSTVLKLSPFIFKLLNLHGTFLFYGVTSSFLTFIMYKHLPETKDKTLQEIELYFQRDTKSIPVLNKLI